MAKTIVLSLGGSLLFEDGKYNEVYLDHLAEVLRQAKRKMKLAVVVGGGVRAREYAKREKNKGEFFADRAAIKATVENAKKLIKKLGRDAFPRVINRTDDALKAIQGNKIAVGSGVLEGLTTDFVACITAERIGASAVVNASKVDGVYSADPRKDRNAKKFKKMTHSQLTELAMRMDARKAGTHFVFDAVACKIAERSNIALHFVDGSNLYELQAALEGKKHSGTIVKD